MLHSAIVLSNKGTGMKRLLCVIFAIYILTVLRITVFRQATLAEYQYNFTLFKDLISVYNNSGTLRFLYLFAGNLIWFAPLGFFLPVILKKNKPQVIILCGFCFSLVIELCQLVFKKGVCELDDLILNTAGTAVGYGIYVLMIKLRRTKDGKEKADSD